MAEEKQQLSIDQAFSLGLKLHGQGNLEQARDIYQKVLTAVPGHYPCMNNMGLLESQAGNPDQAIAWIGKALEQKEDFPEAHNNIGNLFQTMGKPEKALTHLNRAVELKKDYFEAWKNMARTCMDLKRPDMAMEAARKGLKLKPDTAFLEMILGQSLLDMGKTGEAAVRFRRALAIEPESREIMAALVRALRADRNLAGAEETIRRLIARDESSPFGYNMLGVVLQDQGRFEEAIAAYNQALALDPNLSEPCNNRGVSLKHLKRYDEARQSFENALKINPRYCEAYNNLGNLLSSQGDLEGALKTYAAAVEINPDFLEAQANTALCLADMGKFRQAREKLTEPISKNPDSPFLNKALASVLIKLEDYATAEIHLRKALRFLPKDPEVLNLMGNVLNQLGFEREAQVMLHRALELNPRLTGAYNNLGNICATMGLRDKAREYFFQALEIEPENASVLRHLCAVHTFTPDDPLLERLKDMATRKSEFQPEEQVELLYALSAALDNIKEYDQSFSLLLEASKKRRGLLEYDAQATEKNAYNLARVFSPQVVKSLAGIGYPSELPVFIVGMPRSGTSLTEQILASHPDVYGAGELRLMQTALDHGFLIGNIHIDGLPVEQSDKSKALPAREGIFEVGRRYVNGLRTMSPQSLRITDKMPGNFAKLGIIALAMPGAKIIHIRRNPVDTCLSCFRTRFATGQEWSYDLVELGRYYNTYASIMRHWKEVMPDAFMEINYEDLIRDFEASARRLVKYCGLPWDEACMKFYETKRAVKTASLAQVRKPIYATSMDKWRRYEKFLTPLLETLDPELLKEYGI